MMPRIMCVARSRVTLLCPRTDALILLRVSYPHFLDRY